MAEYARQLGETSEDCLYLNVWTPDTEGALPVIVWIYGGGFESGSGAPPITHGAALSRLTETVVVSFNYRVGALGFGHWAGVGGSDWGTASNNGLQDQAAALRWVRRNIGAFGGDTNNVTVAGSSAGAFSIGSLLSAPIAQGLFDKAIMHSGSTRRIVPTSTADDIARDLLEQLGVSSMEELQSVDVEMILNAQIATTDRDIGRRNLPGGRIWACVQDGTVFTANPHEHLRNGGARDIPLLIGANRDEISIFRLWAGPAFEPSNEATLSNELARAGIGDPTATLAAYRLRARQTGRDQSLGDLRAAFLADAIYRRPATEMAADQVRAGGRAWTYLFSAEPAGPELGAFHGADIAYTFDLLAPAKSRPDTYTSVRDALTGAWSAFAHIGNPGWSTYDPASTGNTRNFGGPEFVTEPPPDGASAAWSTLQTTPEQQ
jgi:para-nitrobenzyl esterase